MAESNGYISRGNMTIILSSAGLIMIAFGAFVTQQNNSTDKQISRIEQALDKTLKEQQRRFANIVPRTEHEARWASTNKDLTLLAERLNELRTATSSTYTIRDEVHRMQVEVSELRRLLADRK